VVWCPSAVGKVCILNLWPLTQHGLRGVSSVIFRLQFAEVTVFPNNVQFVRGYGTLVSLVGFRFSWFVMSPESDSISDK